MFNFWWSAGLLDGLKPQKMKCSFLDYINFWWLDGLVDWLKLYLPPMSSQKNEMLIFGLHSTSDDQPGWSMDLNPVLYHSPAKIMKCSFLDYVQLLMIGMVGWWIQTPSATSLQPKKWNAHFWIMFNFCWSAGLVNDNEPHLPHLSSQNNEMLIFGLCSTSDDQLGFLMDSNHKKWNAHFWTTLTSDDWMGWLIDSNCICHPCPAKKMKCSFLVYIQLLMISLAGQWIWTLSSTTLQPK